MMNGEAKQFLLKAAEDGEILPREGLFPALHHFMATRQETLSVQDKYQEPLQEDSKQPDCSPELRRQAGRSSRPAPAPQALHPGAGTRKAAKRFGGRSTPCGSRWDPARLHRPPPQLRGVSFLDPSLLCAFGFPTHIDTVDAARELPCSGPPRMRNWANHTLHQRTFSAWAIG